MRGGIAHDFNNILGGILGYSELAIMDCQRDRQVDKYLKEVLNGVERAQNLVNQILTFSRKNDVELRLVKPEYLIKEALKLLRPSIPSTIEIDVKIESSSLILAEPTQFYQMIMNLFTNAAYAIGENTGKIGLMLKDFYVDEHFAQIHHGIETGKYIIISISDTGCGIDPGIIEHIFDPFYTTKPTGKGTGLGLSVVHGIVKKLNGDITVYSEVGKGTVFNLIIPEAGEQYSEVSSEVNIREKIRGEGRLIIIDDEAAILSTMQSILEKLGYEVTVFNDSEKALSAIIGAPESCDLIITDYAMPRISGISIVKTLIEKGITVPLILMSGYVDMNLESMIRQYGVKEILTKPVSAYQLSSVVNKILVKEFEKK